MALQVNSREFRNNQAAFFNMADNGEQIIIRRGKKQAYLLFPICFNDFVLSSDAETRLAQARKEFEEQNCTVCDTAEEALAHLEAL